VGPLSYEAFLAWADEDALAEWMDGTVIMTSPASARHQLLAAFVFRILARFVELHDLGLCFQAPF
jgi:hypothetical protein